jgi:NAD-dependent DNA ligase
VVIMNFADFVEVSIAASDDLVMARQKPLRGKTFAITGKLEDGVTRTDFAKLLSLWGANVIGVVDYRVDVLLATDPGRRTSKRVAADRHRVLVQNEHAFVASVLIPARTAARLAEAPGPRPGADLDDEAILSRIKPLSDLGA